MNKKRIFVILAACTLVLGGCFSDWKGDEGTLRIRIGDDADGRSAFGLGKEDVSRLVHTITVSGGPGPSQTRKNIKYGATVDFSVTPGRWNISITAYLDGQEYATGSTVVDIKPGPNGSFHIKMNKVGQPEPEPEPEPDKPGDITITINFAQIADNAHLTTKNIADNVGEIYRINITLDDYDQYTSVTWRMNGITGNGPSFTVDLQDGTSGSQYVVMVEVRTTDNVPYSKSIIITKE